VVRESNKAFVGAIANTHTGAAISTDFWSEPMSNVRAARVFGLTCIASLIASCALQDSYVTLIAHQIDDEWTLHRRVLMAGAYDSKKRHEEILPFLTAALQPYGVDTADNKFTFITDGASSYVAIWRRHPGAFTAGGCRGGRSVIISVQFTGSMRVGCIAHALHNSVSCAVAAALPSTHEAIETSKALVRYMKKAELHHALPTKLKQEVPTRWLSIHPMLDSVYGNLMIHKFAARSMAVG